jgi:ubiquinone/menaquinone biosynthesis C-methylase UbiE
MTVDATSAYRHGSLDQAITDALAAAGHTAERPAPDDLGAVDEFHIGGRQATIELGSQLGFRAGMQLLDVGCGIGGASRYFAHAMDCRVSGIDLTEEYVEVARHLATRVGLERRVTYQIASALALPFPARTFDGAYMMHVGMNIEDKTALFAEVARVLKPGTVFGVYDVMREREGDLAFPVPWALTASMSFVATEATYRHALQSAGFHVEHSRSRRAFAVDFFNQMRARNIAGGPPGLDLRILMGPTAPQKIANTIANLERGLISPTEIVCRKG